MTRLPDLIVIGAQKCGTTTLWEDLRRHPDVFIGDKESRVLCGERVDTRELRARYARAFDNAPRDAILGEVSTLYAMLPHNPELPGNARRIAPGARIIYIVRDPVQRIISHHHHDFGLGLVGPDIDEAIDSYPCLLDNTRYATQIAPWLEHFGDRAVQVIKFEEYVADRRGSCARLLSEMGVDPGEYDPGDEAYNAADSKRIASGGWAAVAGNPAYRRVLRPLMGERIRRRVNRAILPKAPPRPDPPSERTFARIVEELSTEVDQLAKLTGRPAFWDLAASVADLRPPNP